MATVVEKFSSGDRGAANEAQDVHQQDEGITWVRPRVDGGRRSLPTEPTGGLIYIITFV